MIFTLLGMLSGLLLIMADIPYFLNAYWRKTQPHRVTWLVIFLINITSFANQLASGATSSLWFFAGASLASFSILVLSLSRGVGGYSKLDATVLAGSLLGLVLWWWFDAPLASILANVVVGILAFIPTFIKVYGNPKSETKITWLLATISALCGALSVGELDITLLMLPINAIIVQASLFILIEVRERSLA